MKYLTAIQNSSAYGTLKQDINNNKLGHAYLVTSYDIELVKVLFISIASSILVGCDCLNCAQCKKIINHNHPDVMHIQSQDGKQIKVEDIKELIESANKSAIEDTNIKLYFIYNGEMMNIAAQNKLLKTLEEAPAGVKIFIATNSERAILDTVKSRTRRLYLDILDTDSIISELKNQYGEREDIKECAYSSGGIIGIAERLLTDNDYKDSYDSVWDMFDNLKSSRDILEYSSKQFLSKDRLSDTLNIMEMVVRDLMSYIISENNIWAKHKIKKMENIAMRYSLQALAMIQEEILGAKAKLNSYCNASNVSDSLLFKILEDRHKCQKL